MKRITYTYGYDVNHGTEDKPQIETVTSEKSIECADENFDADYAVAQREAVGEITIEDIPDPPAEPTQLDRVEAQATYTALMTDTLLEETGA